MCSGTSPQRSAWGLRKVAAVVVGEGGGGGLGGGGGGGGGVVGVQHLCL